jgi:hypothetical protein
MSISLYDISVPVMIKGLRDLSAVLERGRTFADETGLPHSELLQARLIPDMMSLTGQIQRASDTAKFAAVRVGLVENISLPDTEATFDEVSARIATTVNFLAKVPVEAFDGRESGEIVLPAPGGERTYTARSYILEFALPNFFFHTTTAYDLLRHKGVPVGKKNFLGWA